MKGPGHQMILASAGSGKTYALTNRFIALLAAGAGPDRIAALTFTRKAAGEFFDVILKKLAEASASPAEARRIAGEIGSPTLGPADFRRMLRAMVDAMPRLTLGTLDSFFARVVRSFPLELGLGGDFEILREHAARLERSRVVRQMFAAPEAAQRAFTEAFKRATFGTEEKRLGAQLDLFLDEHAPIYLAASEPGLWGAAARIWPQGSPSLLSAPGRTRAVAALQEAIPWAALGDLQRARWEQFFAEHQGWTPGAPLSRPFRYLLFNAIAVWPDVAKVVVERKAQGLPPAAAAALREAVLAIVGSELEGRLEITRGIHAVLRHYEEVYDGAVRRLGRLTFGDLQRLLLPGGGGRPLSREADEARLFIDWRLDAQIDHWLLDEFQDTSYGQWRVLQNLIDEVVQDASGGRSFFYVGDVKQAIFAWRGGDARLFREIFAHYNSAEADVIGQRRLDESWRSGPAVIEMVNRVFGDRAALSRLFPAGAAGPWNEAWKPHTTAKPGLGGYAALRTVAGEEARFAETLRLLEEVRPLERGLEVAILVQDNRTAAELADFLRREGAIPAVAESDLHVARDNPLSCGLLALFRAAAHPRDRTARALVSLTPIEDALAGRGWTSPDALTTGLLAQLHDNGFEKTVEDWLRRIDRALPPDDAFSRLRGRQLASAAREFDELGGRDAAEFAAFAEQHTVRDADLAGAVRIMTVHKAKGLGFDFVILPDLQGDSLAVRREGLAVQRAADRSVEWVLNLPVGQLAAFDPVLAAYVEADKADACYEQLCLLYVAMTRAKRAMVALVDPPPKSSKAVNFPRLLRETLGENWECGDRAWYQALALRSEVKAADEISLQPLPGTAGRPRRTARRPSGLHAGIFAAAPLFELAAETGAEFGTQVHDWLARVKWAGDAASMEIAQAPGAAAAEAAACLAAPELASIWTRPDPGAEAWTERDFEFTEGAEWFTGKFDRVVVSRGPDGRIRSASLYDFKTDQAEGEQGVAAAVERHAAQLNLYRKAVAALTGLTVAKVSAEIVLTRARRRAPIPL
ncbi:MAG TPA: UvrD-helicase domain-containing protein [Opitutaceae bacterium]|nr:UvrD-helicase domain-containing protein [Opitutaceae bacterium]